MPETFDFEAFISGLSVDLPRFDVPLYGVLNQAEIIRHDERIAEADNLLAEIAAAIREADESGAEADERESSDGSEELVADQERVKAERAHLVQERDRLAKEQDDSALWLELRALTAQEFADVAAFDNKEQACRQLAAQTKGTRNEMTYESWQRIREAAMPGAFSLVLARANQIVGDRMVMPDFSLGDSRTPSPPKSSAS